MQKLLSSLERFWFSLTVRWNPWYVKPSLCIQVERELAGMAQSKGERLDSCEAEIAEPGIVAATVSIGARTITNRISIVDCVIGDKRHSLNYWLLAVAQERYQ